MSSIEWLANLIKESDKKGYSLQLSKLDEWVKQAKVMHKKEIIDAFIDGNRQEFYDATETLGEKYYKENFKNNKS